MGQTNENFRRFLEDEPDHFANMIGGVGIEAEPIQGGYSLLKPENRDERQWMMDNGNYQPFVDAYRNAVADGYGRGAKRYMPKQAQSMYAGQNVRDYSNDFANNYLYPATEAIAGALSGANALSGLARVGAEGLGLQGGKQLWKNTVLTENPFVQMSKKDMAKKLVGEGLVGLGATEAIDIPTRAITGNTVAGNTSEGLKSFGMNDTAADLIGEFSNPAGYVGLGFGKDGAAIGDAIKNLGNKSINSIGNGLRKINSTVKDWMPIRYTAPLNNGSFVNGHKITIDKNGKLQDIPIDDFIGGDKSIISYNNNEIEKLYAKREELINKLKNKELKLTYDINEEPEINVLKAELNEVTKKIQDKLRPFKYNLLDKYSYEEFTNGINPYIEQIPINRTASINGKNYTLHTEGPSVINKNDGSNVFLAGTSKDVNKLINDAANKKFGTRILKKEISSNSYGKDLENYINGLSDLIEDDGIITGSSVLYKGENPIISNNIANDVELITTQSRFENLNKKLDGIQNRPLKQVKGFQVSSRKIFGKEGRYGNVDINILETDESGRAKGLNVDSIMKTHKDSNIEKETINPNTYDSYNVYKDKRTGKYLTDEDVYQIALKDKDTSKKVFKDNFFSHSYKHAKRIHDSIKNNDRKAIELGKEDIEDFYQENQSMLRAREAFPNIDLKDVKENRKFLKKYDLPEEYAEDEDMMNFLFNKFYINENFITRRTGKGNAGNANYNFWRSDNERGFGNFTNGNIGGGNSYGGELVVFNRISEPNTSVKNINDVDVLFNNNNAYKQKVFENKDKIIEIIQKSNLPNKNSLIRNIEHYASDEYTKNNYGIDPLISLGTAGSKFDAQNIDDRVINNIKEHERVINEISKLLGIKDVKKSWYGFSHPDLGHYVANMSSERQNVNSNGVSRFDHGVFDHRTNAKNAISEKEEYDVRNTFSPYDIINRAKRHPYDDNERMIIKNVSNPEYYEPLYQNHIYDDAIDTYDGGMDFRTITFAPKENLYSPHNQYFLSEGNKIIDELKNNLENKKSEYIEKQKIDDYLSKIKELEEDNRRRKEYIDNIKDTEQYKKENDEVGRIYYETLRNNEKYQRQQQRIKTAKKLGILSSFPVGMTGGGALYDTLDRNSREEREMLIDVLDKVKKGYELTKEEEMLYNEYIGNQEYSLGGKINFIKLL